MISWPVATGTSCGLSFIVPWSQRGLALAGVLMAVVTTSAHAALDAGVTTGVTNAQTDGTTLVGILASAGAAVLIIHRLLKRFGVSL